MSVQILVSLSQTNFSMFTITSVNSPDPSLLFAKSLVTCHFPSVKLTNQIALWTPQGIFRGFQIWKILSMLSARFALKSKYIRGSSEFLIYWPLFSKYSLPFVIFSAHMTTKILIVIFFMNCAVYRSFCG